MTPYRLDYDDVFKGQLAALDNSFAPAARKAIEKIKNDPHRGKGLHGKWGYYEVRFDPYRIKYTVDEGTKTITFLELGKRDNIFRR